jgi:hypothetical protein
MRVKKLATSRMVGKKGASKGKGKELWQNRLNYSGSSAQTIAIQAI